MCVSTSFFKLIGWPPGWLRRWPMRRAAKRDANEGDIVAALRTVGCYVIQQDEPCDLWVGYRGRWYSIEVKDGSKPPSARKLTDQQLDHQKKSAMCGAPFDVAENVQQALMIVGAVR